MISMPRGAAAAACLLSTLSAQHQQWQVANPLGGEHRHLMPFVDYDADGFRDYLRLSYPSQFAPWPYLQIASGKSGDTLYEYTQLPVTWPSGACHAGQYETSLVLAVEPGLVDERAAQGLPASTLSLSEGIAAGKTTFKALGMDQAYTGSPAEATREEGAEMLERLATMIVREVVEGLESLG